jgi:uncharacterized repeat protein (TIGR03803 family)
VKIPLQNLFLALATCLAVPGAQAGVVFTNLVFFTNTNAPDYGWNIGAPSGLTGALVQGRDGNFYGTVFSGGANFDDGGNAYDETGNGTVFKMTPDGQFTTLYSFNNRGLGDGSHPVGSLIMGADGYLYGTTEYGGNVGRTDGTIFQITPNGALTTLYSFGSRINPDGTDADGRFPFAGLIQGRDGNFYGTTTAYGNTSDWGGTGADGTVFQFIPGGNLNTLFSFPPSGNPAWSVDGSMPFSALVEGNDGNFYGTTYWGGTNGVGTIFCISSGGTFTTVASFVAGDTGSYPTSALLLARDGNFYGTAPQGGASDYGTVFQMTTNGMLTTLYSFSGQSDGGVPSGLMQGSDGNFYGTTGQGGNDPSGMSPGYGTVFQITTNGTLTTLYSFSGPDGQTPQGTLVQGTDGSFYGTTSYGGPGFDPSNPGYGAIFRIIIPPAFQTITQSNGVATLTWSILPGQTYQVQSSPDLSSTNWLNLGSSVTATNSAASATDSMTNAQCFYRILLTQ